MPFQEETAPLYLIPTICLEVSLLLGPNITYNVMFLKCFVLLQIAIGEVTTRVSLGQLLKALIFSIKLTKRFHCSSSHDPHKQTHVVKAPSQTRSAANTRPVRESNT